ncbi:hypothetical protein FJ943_14670 [Mesorhizobium sp. B2-3-10]|nr:hypothetical protein FJ943_14670 [Mesorhizobium sp. B2-3-10]
MGCATSARSDLFEKGASKSGSLMPNGFFSVPSLMMARRRTSARHRLGWHAASRGAWMSYLRPRVE